MERTHLDVQLYRAALWLHPAAFRREFSPQMLRDFIEARAEALTSHERRGLWVFRARMGADLIRSIIHQWLRTGWPVILILAVTGPLTAVSLLARMWRPISFDLPIDAPNADLITIELLAVVAFMIIAATIIFTVAFAFRVHSRRRF
jgi:hypothetical protein